MWCDGDIKVIANKFWWKYLRQDQVNLIRSLHDKSQFIALTSNTTFWWALQTQAEWVISEPAWTHHLGLKAQKFENPIFTFGCFSLKPVYNSWKLQRLLQVAKFLFMYSFTHTNIVFLFRHLPTKFVTFVTRWSVSVRFLLFLEAGFANIPPIFWFHVKLKQGIQRY